MAKWEVKRLFQKEFRRLEGSARRDLWIRFCLDLLENNCISEKTFNKCWKASV